MTFTEFIEFNVSEKNPKVVWLLDIGNDSYPVGTHPLCTNPLSTHFHIFTPEYSSLSIHHLDTQP